MNAPLKILAAALYGLLPVGYPLRICKWRRIFNPLRQTQSLMLKKIAYAMLASVVILASVSVVGNSSFAAMEDDSVFPDQSKSNDYGIRIAATEDDSVFPDQSKSIDYGIRAAG